MTLVVRTYGASGATIDIAESDSPEAAVVAARTLLLDAHEHAINGAPHVRAAFYRDGVLVRQDVRLQELPQ